MVNIRTGIRSEEVRHDGQHVLFVEGGDENSIDPKVLNVLFSGALRIEPIGPAFRIRAVAEALSRYHPTYYFLIDRDHHKDSEVDRSWKEFPNPDNHNLLIWRRRELENYFLDPTYLVCSKFCRVDVQVLGDMILRLANERLFLDVANWVVVSIREELKRNWIKLFRNPAEFTSKEEALCKLKTTAEFTKHVREVRRQCSSKEIEKRFEKCLDMMTGGRKELVVGQGRWHELIRGKRVLTQVVNSTCFEVKATSGESLVGRKKLFEVVEELLKNGGGGRPEDFDILQKLVGERVREHRA